MGKVPPPLYMGRTGTCRTYMIAKVGFWPGLSGQSLSHRMHLSTSLRKSTPPQNRQLIVDYYYLEQQVDDFVGEMTS